MNSFYVINIDSRNELIKQGFKVLSEEIAVNGETVWTMSSCGLVFDINKTDLPGVIPCKNFRLNF